MALSKNRNHDILKNEIFVVTACSADAAARAAAKRTKSLEKSKLPLVDLQALEIVQNRQGNPWKSLQKKAPDLEKLAKKAW